MPRFRNTPAALAARIYGVPAMPLSEYRIQRRFYVSRALEQRHMGYFADARNCQRHMVRIRAERGL